jgi:hypothetical protein
MAATKCYLNKAIAFFLSIVIIVHLTLVQRFYLSRSNSGKEWRVLTIWFGLSDWLLHERHTPKSFRQRKISDQGASSGAFRVSPKVN